MISRLEHLCREFLYGIKRSIGSHLAPVVLIAVALFILGLFLTGTRNINELIHIAHSKVGITIYLADDATEEEREGLQEWLPKLGGVRTVVYCSKEEALDKFREELGGRSYLLEGVGANPLPASFEADVYDDWKTAEKMADLTSRIMEAAGVESVVYGENWVGQLEKWIYFVVALDLFLGIVLGVSTLLVVGNTMRLALEGRKDTVEVLRLVGASNTQIRLPFLAEGALIGLLASSLAFALLYKTWDFAADRLTGVLFVGPGGAVFFFLLGGALGACGSLLCINKYLKVRRG